MRVLTMQRLMKTTKTPLLALVKHNDHRLKEFVYKILQDDTPCAIVQQSETPTGAAPNAESTTTPTTSLFMPVHNRPPHRRQVQSQNHSAVVVTNENRTSMTCPYCLQRVIHPRKKVSNKTKTNLGTSCCINPACPSVKECWNSFGRDTISATCIALQAYGLMTNDPVF
ncbi:hypothetical protein DM01DRAFT_1386104 [Hesseltinella vesiculosa]|uniref:Uncharacterized protein n=1 Tax=Hesseltinella vesiculosa TaxID=101127 RepID=A0A1X2G711_9FUNG|nr:hypothetical protein DM01DRAFT_1386104 [Hesseltinella vesiculosa]